MPNNMFNPFQMTNAQNGYGTQSTNNGSMTWPGQMAQMGMTNAFTSQNNQNTKPVSGFPGRMINDPNEVMPYEVPSNGSIAIFPSMDGYTIWVKAYGPDGLIHPLCYRLDQPDVPNQPSEFDRVMQRLDQIEEIIAGLGSSKQNQQNRKWDQNRNNNNNQQKKEEQANG